MYNSKVKKEEIEVGDGDGLDTPGNTVVLFDSSQSVSGIKSEYDTDRPSSQSVSGIKSEYDTDVAQTFKFTVSTSSFPYECLICERILPTAVAFSTHITSHILGHKGALCGICYSAFANHIRLNEHYKLCHNMMICYGCERYLLDTNQVKFVHHLPVCEAYRKYMPTGKVGLNAATSIAKASAEDSSRRGDGKRLSNCKQCSRNKRYECDVCDYVTSHPNHLVVHKRKHTQEKPYMCNICGYASACVSSLIRHKRQHTGEKPFICNVCGFATTRVENLLRHKRKHTGDKPYKCDKCTFASANANHLVKHKRRVNACDKKKDYVCNVCGYVATEASDLVGHMRDNHIKKKKYICEVCGFATGDKVRIVTHKYRHTGEKPYKCDVCTFATACTYSLAQHKRRHT